MILKIYCILSMLIAALIVIMDPYFHYHKPFGWQKYGWWQERYINDGILKNFDYNAIIAGNSMVENFKVSEFNELFGTETVKVPYSGASFEEVGGGYFTRIKYRTKCEVCFMVS